MTEPASPSTPVEPTPAEPTATPGVEPDVAARLDALQRAVDAASGHLDPALLRPAAGVTGRGAERLKLSGEHTIVALGGATGSGKSSLFNALADLEIAGTGVRRPTTTWALACAWGPDGAQELLEWMGIPARHQVSRQSMLDRSSDDTRLDGLVLLDLPDHDSTEVSHHLEMERLLPYSDTLVWVLDPQKYADAAIHDRYIRPMAAYADVTIVVLNQIDRIPFDQRERALADLRRILAEEGLPDVPVIGISAARGDGVDDLKRELARRIRAKQASRERLGTELSGIASGIADVVGTAEVPGIGEADVTGLEDGLASAAGVPDVVESIGSVSRRRAVRTTTWPLARLVRGKDRSGEVMADESLTVASLRRAQGVGVGGVQPAAAEQAVRDFADKAAVGMSRPWATAVRETADARQRQVVDTLDERLGSADLGLDRTPAGWYLLAALQWLLLLAGIAGVAWLVAMAFGQEWNPLAVVLAVGGLLGGIVLALLTRPFVVGSARKRAARAEAALREVVHDVAREHVVEPLEGVVADYRRTREGLLVARG
jgi:GTP-binding protein EngB required for normal cell division